LSPPIPKCADRALHPLQSISLILQPVVTDAAGGIVGLIELLRAKEAVDVEAVVDGDPDDVALADRLDLRRAVEAFVRPKVAPPE
jgi:hypothetical protein